jgi:hypothetical protein
MEILFAVFAQITLSGGELMKDWERCLNSITFSYQHPKMCPLAHRSALVLVSTHNGQTTQIAAQVPIAVPSSRSTPKSLIRAQIYRIIPDKIACESNPLLMYIISSSSLCRAINGQSSRPSCH